MTLWEIRKVLENSETKKQFADSLVNGICVLVKDGIVLNANDSIRILNESFSYASFWWHCMKIVSYI